MRFESTSSVFEVSFEPGPRNRPKWLHIGSFRTTFGPGPGNRPKCIQIGQFRTISWPTDHLPPTTYHLPPTAYRLPPTAYHPPPTTYRLPPTAYHLPPTTYHLPPTAYHVGPFLGRGIWVHLNHSNQFGLLSRPTLKMGPNAPARKWSDMVGGRR